MSLVLYYYLTECQIDAFRDLRSFREKLIGKKNWGGKNVNAKSYIGYLTGGGNATGDPGNSLTNNNAGDN